MSRLILFGYLIFILFAGLAVTNTYTVGPPGSGAQYIAESGKAQDGINQALLAASNAGGGTVYLLPGVYEVTDIILVGSNTVFTGDPNAIVRVSSSASQYFTGTKGVIGSLTQPINNVEIWGFQVDGNCENLPSSYADSGGDHNAGRLIYIQGLSESFCQNIRIHDMQLYDAFSDGIHLGYVNNVYCYNNFCSNCQHEGIYYVEGSGGAIYNNRVAGITSDCMRLDNCMNIMVTGNTLFSYTGDHNNGAPKAEQNGLQVGDMGHSHGGGSPKKDHTTNIEVTGNTFADCGTHAIMLDEAGISIMTNVYIHDNNYVNMAGTTTSGQSIGGIPTFVSKLANVTGPTNTSVNTSNVSATHPPSVEMSKQIFADIFDVLNMNYSSSGRTTQTGDQINYTVTETSQGKISGGIKIVGYKDLIKINGTEYISGNNSTLTKYSVLKSPTDVLQSLGQISNIDKQVTTTIKNGTAYATLTVNMKWSTIKTDSTGKSKKKIHTATATFHDTAKAPQILVRSLNKTAYIDVFPEAAIPTARVSVDDTGLQRIEFKYGKNTSTHTFLIGQRQTEQNGLEYTNYTKADLWEGSIPNMDNILVIPGKFDQNQLEITCYTPYENYTVNDYKIVIHEPEKSVWAYPMLAWFLKMALMLYCGYKIMKCAMS